MIEFSGFQARTTRQSSVHEAKRALPNTAGSLELSSVYTWGALFRETMSHHPRIGYFPRSNGGVGRRSSWFKEQWIKSTQGPRNHIPCITRVIQNPCRLMRLVSKQL